MSVAYRGARWWRCDLHVHTPFDRRQFGEDLRHVVAESGLGNQEPLATMARRFWTACAGIDIVGVTDHNSVNGYRRLAPFLASFSQAAKEANEHAPVFLPGVELTVGAERAMHFLVLFSSDCSADLVDQAVQGIFRASPRHDENGDPLPTTRSIGDFLADLKAFCTPDNGERRVPFLVIPAHVESNSGLAVETGIHDHTGPEILQQMRGVLREGAITRAAWHGFQTTNEYVRLPSEMRELLCVWEANRRDQRWEDLGADEKAAIRTLEHWPLVEASDPQAYDEIGRRYSWLKMAEPDLEGIRLALLDPESRLRRMEAGEPGRSHPQIRSISIRRTDFFENLELSFSSNMTTLIGGRGSGKSTLVELIRYGLARDQAADFNREEKETREALERLLRTKPGRDSGSTSGMLLPDTAIEVHFTVAGIEYQTIRTPASFEVRRLTASDPDLPDGTPIDVRSLIKPQILSQGQIARIARDPGAQRREIDRIASDDPRANDFERRRGAVAVLIEQAQSDLRSAREDEGRLSPALTELQTVRDQLEVLESGSSRETLQRFQGMERDTRLLVAWRATFDDQATALREAADATTDAANRLAAPNGSDAFVLEQAQRSKVALLTAADTARSAAEELMAHQQEFDSRRETEWDPRRETVIAAYEALLGQLRSQGIALDGHAALVGLRSTLEERIAALQQSAERAPVIAAEVARLWNELRELHLARNAARRAVEAMLVSQNADIRLIVIPFGDRTSVDALRDDWFGGANLHTADWETLLDWVFADDNGVDDRWRKLIEALMLDRRLAEGNDASTGANVLELIGGAPDQLSGHLWRAIPRMDTTHLESMFRMLPEDRVEAAVRDPDGEFKPMEQGSLGQRSTAIISLMLSSGDQPLVIDQPEEDLDNQYVYRVVVDLLRKRKFSRQLVLATHNANIPVNGDAELIVSMQVDGKLGVIGSLGSIDQQTVKDDVNSILEGSAEAFRLRRRRYGY